MSSSTLQDGKIVASEVAPLNSAQASSLAITYIELSGVVAARGTFSLSGQNILLPVSYAALPADQGTYTLSGQSASMLAARILSASQGSFGLSGQTVFVPASFRLDAAQGTLAVSGQEVTFTVSGGLPVDQGAFTLTGQTVTFAVDQAISQGAISLSGQALGVTLVTVAVQGSFALNGQAVNLTITRVLAGNQGAFALSGQDAGFSFGAPVLQGAFSLNGQAVTLTYNQAGESLALESGTFTENGQATTFALRVPVVQGALALSGQAVLLPVTYIEPMTQGSFTLSGQSVLLPVSYTESMTQGSFTLSGQDVTLTVNTGPESLSPDAILDQTNLTGAVGDIDDDPDSADANWLTADSNNQNSICRVSFATPASSPTTGAGGQEFRIWARVTPNASTVSYTVDLYENGTEVSAGIATGSISSTTGEIISATWDATLLGTADGSLVECFIEFTKTGGPPNSRSTGEVGAIEWNVT